MHQDGNWSEGRRNGEGKLTFAKGNVYVGQWKNDRLHGKGQLRFSNGDVYIGEFVQGRRQDFGVYKYANGEEFEGSSADHPNHGDGTVEYLSGGGNDSGADGEAGLVDGIPANGNAGSGTVGVHEGYDLVVEMTHLDVKRNDKDAEPSS